VFAALLRILDLRRLAAAEHLVRPAQEHPAVFGRDAEHVADHDHRHPARNVGHEVALAARGDRVDQLVAQRAQLRLVVCDAPHRETAIHEVAAALVQRVVEVDHRRDPRPGVGPRALGRAEDLRVLRGVHDVGVPGEAPEPAQLVHAGLEVGGRVVAHPAEPLVRVEIEEPVEQVDVVAGGVAGHDRTILSTIDCPPWGIDFRFGRLAAACAIAVCFGAQARAEGGAFSIAVLPDTQNMVDYRHQEVEGFPFDASELFLGEMRWIADHAQGHGGDIAFVAAVGDVWQHQTLAIDPAHERRGFKRIENPWFATELEITPKTRTVETVTALQGYALLAKAGLAFGVAPGNHDYDAMWSDSRYPAGTDAKQDRHDAEDARHAAHRRARQLPLVFRPKRYRGQAVVRGELHAAGQAARRLPRRRLHLPAHRARDVAVRRGAEMGAVGDREAPGLPTIVTTHDYLNAKGERRANPIIDLAAVDPTTTAPRTCGRS
jgi:hypothetical protein